MKSIAGMCKLNSICFTSEEFRDLWTTPYSDCVNIDCWKAPTMYEIWHLLESPNREADFQEIVQRISRDFKVDAKWTKTIEEYWEQTKLFIQK